MRDFIDIVEAAGAPKADRLLVIVHPGSACGSADFNLGEEAAERARAKLIAEINAWNGPCLILDGELSDELPGTSVGAAVDACLGRAYPGQRVFACAMSTRNWPNKSRIAVNKIAAKDAVISITGAWHHLGDDEGCCNTVLDTLTQAGFNATITPGALVLDHGDDDAEYEAMTEGARQRSYPLADRDGWYGDANYEQTGGIMTMMTPDEFLARARHMETDDEATQENIESLKQHILDGGVLDPLALYSNGREDGRHRAHACKALGIDRVPVLQWPAKSTNAGF